MNPSEPDLLSIDRGVVVAPAGCGKTQLIAESLRRHSGTKPILVLTHTNAGVAALRARLERAGVDRHRYRLSTIDAWAIRLISTFPVRAAHDPAILQCDKPDYRAIREAASRLVNAGHISDVLEASYARMLVDEYQDCSIRQHAIACHVSKTLPTCVVGDPLQAIFGFGDDQLADWNKHVVGHFGEAGKLAHPWRWINAGAKDLGDWLLLVRKRLLEGQAIDLATAPHCVSWVELNGSVADHEKCLQAARTTPPGGVGSVLIIGDSASPQSQRRFASQTPGAVTIEAVDLRDLVDFARDLNLNGPKVLEQVSSFAQNVMTNVGAADLLKRVGILTRGTARKSATEAELAAMALLRDRTPSRVIDLLVEIQKEGGVRAHRPEVLRACLRALRMCQETEGLTLHDAAVRIREHGRFQGRAIPRRAVGSTLLLKGLEAEVAVVLNADSLNSRNLYVALTRGSKRLVICSRKRLLSPSS